MLKAFEFTISAEAEDEPRRRGCTLLRELYGAPAGARTRRELFDCPSLSHFSSLEFKPPPAIAGTRLLKAFDIERFFNTKRGFPPPREGEKVFLQTGPRPTPIVRQFLMMRGLNNSLSRTRWTRLLKAFEYPPWHQEDVTAWIVPVVRAEVLRLLFTNRGEELYTRELARLSFLALRTVQDELAKLEAAKLIVSRSNGYQRFYRANPKSPAPCRAGRSCSQRRRTRQARCAAPPKCEIQGAKKSRGELTTADRRSGEPRGKRSSYSRSATSSRVSGR